MLEKDFLVPRRLQKGDTIGIFTPSSPAYRFNPELFENGVRNIEGMGFKQVFPTNDGVKYGVVL